MAAPLSVIVVIACPDQRHSRSALHAAVVALDRRPDVRVSTFVLRGDPPEPAWPNCRVVDDLRTWAPARTADRFGGPRLAGRVRGLRLRAWLAKERPDVVLLEGGLGGRIEALVRRPHVTVVNLGSVSEDPFEAPYAKTPDIVIIGPGCEDDATRLWPGVEQRVYPATRDPGARERIRSELGVPDGAVLVTGRGEDGWLDGPELFIRTLWELDHRHDIDARGVWFGLGADVHQVVRLRDEIARCGLDGRVQIVGDPGETSIGAGDVVLLPYRHAAHPQIPMAEIAAGSPVVTFPVWDQHHPALHVVPHLDLAAAADAIAAATRSRACDGQEGDGATGPAAWAARLVADVESARR
jgi:hypothetical protein